MSLVLDSQGSFKKLNFKNVEFFHNSVEFNNKKTNHNKIKMLDIFQHQAF